METINCQSSGFIPTQHAIERYQERFARNASYPIAFNSLTKIANSARLHRRARGGASAYRTCGFEMIVADKRILTIYRVGSKEGQRYEN